MIKKIRKFINSISGTAAIELGLSLPILMLLATGGFEMTRYIIINQKISKTVSTMGDLVARSPKISEGDMTSMFYAVEHLLEPYPSGASSKVIISSVSNNGTNTRVRWQRTGGGTFAGYAGNTTVSKIGAQGANATLPTGFTLDANEDTIVSEVFYDYKPLIAPNIVGAKVIYRVKYSKPRLGSLTVMNP